MNAQREAECRECHNVYVGNIPFELGEDDVKSLFFKIGPLRSFRLIFSREQGRHKGYGFAEFFHRDAAESAVRNLSNFKLQGRELNVRPLNQGHTCGRQPVVPAFEVRTENSPPITSSIPENAPQPFTVASLPTMIGSQLDTFKNETLLEFVTTMKDMATSDPLHTIDFLREYPQLQDALHHSLVRLQLVGPAAMCQLACNQPTMAAPFLPTGIPPLPMIASTLGEPAATFPMAPPPGYASEKSVQKAELIRQVLELTSEQIKMLSPHQQKQITLLKERLGRGELV